jgi:hypothetical protein
MSDEGTRKHKFEGTRNDGGQSGTIYDPNSGKGSANNGTCNQVDYKYITYGNSIGDTTKGVEA